MSSLLPEDSRQKENSKIPICYGVQCDSTKKQIIVKIGTNMSFVQNKEVKLKILLDLMVFQNAPNIMIFVRRMTISFVMKFSVAQMNLLKKIILIIKQTITIMKGLQPPIWIQMKMKIMMMIMIMMILILLEEVMVLILILILLY